MNPKEKITAILEFATGFDKEMCEDITDRIMRVVEEERDKVREGKVRKDK